MVDKRLLEIKPPTVITRIPRSIQHHVKFWKATEYRNWLLYYSLPCLKGILPDDYYQHYALLVGGITLLSGRSISPGQLQMAGKFLIHFVEMFDVYYDPRYVLMNQHMLLHLEKSVRDHGPLWSSSLFVFEDWNGDLSNYFHGTQNIAIQIMTAVTSQQSFPEMIKEIPPGHAKDLVLRLRGQTNRTNRMHLKNEFFAIGALKKGHLVHHLKKIFCFVWVWSPLNVSLSLNVYNLGMPFFTHKCTREFQEETTSPLRIAREGTQAMAKLKCSFWLRKLSG